MDECPICLTNLNTTITVTGCCQKSFHTECYLKCMKQKAECPLCRSSDYVIKMENELPQIVIMNEQQRISTHARVSQIILAWFVVGYLIYSIK
jgi:predicted transporter